MLCVPMTFHCKCKTCNSYFKETVGDCIGPFSFNLRCPYCRSKDVETVTESAVKETFSYIKNRLSKIMK